MAKLRTNHDRLVRQSVTGIIAHADSVLAGHGPGVASLLTARVGKIEAVIDPKAKIADNLGLR